MSRPLRILSVLSLSLLLTGLASCGGGGGGSTVGAEGSVPVLQLVHPNTPMALHVNMDGLRRSPYYQELRDMDSALSERERQNVGKLFQLLDRSDHFVVGFDPFGSGPDDTLIALRGAFESSHLDVLDEFDELATHREHALRGRGSEWTVIPNADTLLFGQLEQVHDGLDRLDGIYPASGPTRPGFAEAAALCELGQHDVGAVWVFTDEMRAGLGEGHVEHVLHENGVSAGMSVDLRDGVHFRGFVTTNDTAAVPVLAHALQEALGELPSEPVMVALGLTAILEQVQITEEGTTLRVELRATDDQVRGVISNFQQFLQSSPQN
ncbi:MAG: hypothetical protein IPG17_14055 [Sandaracinaceae bacterium]|nr:hypothetical protein [Sandaracinaceae bacterium]MBP7680512.1 hypothetical protein [Deltaproteobacteria bacterium]MBK6809601.1 hypothetical protein [Sandaracinaceae bacterium]MBK7156691.1 hypothetical protein [Sandaracinaceae bacterium]MBK7778504.1 hypothetical protein [Sandaracinaceae bacterium]